MNRIVAVLVAGFIFVLIDIQVAISFASAGFGLIAAGLFLLAPLLVWALLHLPLKPPHGVRSRRSRRLFHRGATKNDYDPWGGGGLG
jgi:hypothetical protein